MPALLESIAGACRMLIVNDNSPDPSPHAAILNASRFAREGRIVVNRTPFSDFAAARNVCLRLHGELRAGQWVAFVDADEVHGEPVNRVARNLRSAAADLDAVEGYTWHFFASPDWYMSIERRMMFFRYAPQLRWEGAVHERLAGLGSRRAILPYVYAHYGWIMPVQRQALKGRQYSSLGAAGEIVPEESIGGVELQTYFEYAHRWRSAMRFRGRHPRAARAVIERMRHDRCEEFALAEALVRRNQPLPRRLANAVMKLNYEQRWRLRALNPQARELLAR